MTEILVKDRFVTAFEIDYELITYLNNRFHEVIKNKRLTLNQSDILKIWDKASLHDKSYNLVANLPYYIATNILLRAFDDKNCKNIIVMTQKEVALKFVAKVNQKQFCALSVFCDLVSTSKTIVTIVPSSAFKPAPKVESAVISIEKNSLKIDDEFKTFLKICFKAPRKKLFKNIADSYDKVTLNDIFDKLKINNDKRPHEVDTEQYSQIYRDLKEKYE